MKPRHSLRTRYLYPIMLCLLLLGCSKAQTLIRILGTWTLVNVTDVNADILEDWVFDVDDILVIYTYDKYNPDSLLTEFKGKYDVRVRLNNKYIDITGFEGGMSFMNAEWEIVKSNKNVLILANDFETGLLIREFTKREF